MKAFIAGALLAGSCGLSAVVTASPAGAISPTVSTLAALADTQVWDVSADGRYVLVRPIGVAPQPIQRVDMTNGDVATVVADGIAAAMSNDGNVVAFSSAADGLVGGDTDGQVDVFRHNIAAATTELASVDVTAGFEPDGTVPVAISADGSSVAYVEVNGTGGTQAMVRDFDAGATISPTADIAAGGGGRKDSLDPRLSGDGQFVSFTLFTANAPCTTEPGCGEIWRYDTVNDQLALVSATLAGTESTGVAGDADISDDGRFVSFVSDGGDLVVGAAAGTSRVYRRDVLAGATFLVGPFSRGSGPFGGDPRISADGKRVAFMADAATGGGTDAQVHVRDLGESQPAQIGVAAGGGTPDNPTFDPLLSADGRTVAFSTTATNLLSPTNSPGGMVAALGEPDILPAPARLVDTRIGLGAPAGLTNAFEEHALTVAGQAGVPADAKAVWLNFTVTEPPAAGFLTAYPCGSPQPLASNLNFAPGQTVANLVLVGVGTGGQVCWFTDHPAHVLVDVQTFEPAGSTYQPVTPVRLLDTRDGTGGRVGSLPPGEVLELTVAGTNGVPADASAVALNVTVADALDGGYLTAFPCGTPPPWTSNLNYAPMQQVAGLAVVKVGTDGKVCFAVGNQTHVIADLQGFEPATSDFTGITPVRLLDTRENVGGRNVPLEGDVVYELVLDTNVVPFPVGAVVLNATITEPVEGGYLTVFTCGEPVAAKSNVNFGPGLTVPNLVIVVPDANHKVCFYPTSDTELVVDVFGWKTAT